MPRLKRISVSSKRQISIPKEYYDYLNLKDEVTLELHKNYLVLRPMRESFEDFSEEILADLIAEGYSGEELMTEFRQRKGQIGNAVESLISETLTKGKKTTVDDLFGEV
ncbi:AbrB/MazE/SpoVT family DNA-binding domain-containing protein [Bacillus dakarensis]|uniref:AbrB/MazE/SpoVT family DNA-binding domain-containing protein n=1 Tax=Robertmurraya dakarensis TaxID=1926278 RepID=UPI001F2E8FDC|nr:AbrB/MazE/SpoVT family DNA-binding domain-containing protein [Bacillus dakarensis]